MCPGRRGENVGIDEKWLILTFEGGKSMNLTPFFQGFPWNFQAFVRA
jgi:hypothetical protein